MAPSDAEIPTMMIGLTFGSRWLARIRHVPAPIDRAATTYSVSRKASICERMTRALPTQKKSESAPKMRK